MLAQQVQAFARGARLFLEAAHTRVGPPRVLLRRLAQRRSCSGQPHHAALTTPTPADEEFPRFHGATPRVDQSPNVTHPPRGSAILPTRKTYASSASVPVTCPGCGALAQTLDPAHAGFYTRSRRAVKEYLSARRAQEGLHVETWEAGEAKGPDGDASTYDTEVPGPDICGAQGIDAKTASLNGVGAPPTPVCDRCHDLVHNRRGTPIQHPSIEDIADSIAESPFNRNHVYHVLDAADFPMSLIPSIVTDLSLARPRSQNRRSQDQYTRRPTLSFIITRSDLLGPTKEKVDSLMSYFQATLRAGLGHSGKSLRLGNVHLVSAKRGWWTREIKEAIWQRGGGNWMVGKFNVGKSNLFEVLFPKGSGERAPSYAHLVQRQAEQMQAQPLLPESSLLPPPQPEERFPTLPLVSSLPGTTASPIRLPFGNSKGELIDLPGLERAKLDQYVQLEHKLDLVMEHRPNVTQLNIKPGQSLLLGGGLVRITPVVGNADRSTTMQAYAFVPLTTHVTSTEKAVGLESQERQRKFDSVLAPSAEASLRSVGIMKLTTDVTKRRAVPLLRAGVPLLRLPFRVFATDILIEGVGWVELVCQVRRRRSSKEASNDDSVGDVQNESSDEKQEQHPSDTLFTPYFSEGERAAKEEEEVFPVVEVFSPNGASVAQRECMGAWDLWQAGTGRKQRDAAARPRRSMKGTKAQVKAAARASSSQSSAPI